MWLFASTYDNNEELLHLSISLKLSNSKHHRSIQISELSLNNQDKVYFGLNLNEFASSQRSKTPKNGADPDKSFTSSLEETQKVIQSMHVSIRGVKGQT